jgi:glycosyltransferase involved in cell wall biosynthesis
MVKISVIIPVYNDEKFLGECLDSVSNQTLDDIEIICINDGSTDSSLEILNEYSTDKRITIITQTNQGSAIARNKGLDIAQGEYIGFLDADDIYINKQSLEIMFDAAKKHDASMISANLKFLTQ